MAIYRSIRIAFWTDTKIVDEFTPEDRYFYLYLFTNPHTNLAGCYELSLKQAAVELGYDITAIKSLIKRFDEVHQVVKYSEATREILLLNWHKYNWTSSEKFRKPLEEEIGQIKDGAFRTYLMSIFNGSDTVSIPYPYGTDTTDTVTDTVSVTDTVADTISVTAIAPKKSALKEEFETLWSIYPRKQGKEKAFGYYEKARKSGATYDEIEYGIISYIRYVQAEQTDPQYIKMGSTFFSQKAWKDDWTVVIKPRSSGNAFDDMCRRMTGKGAFDD